jgi:hypothetical protein
MSVQVLITRTAGNVDSSGRTQTPMETRQCPMNRLEDFKDIFAGVRPWAGEVPKGFSVDFLGNLTDVTFCTGFTGDPMAVGGRYVQTELPRLGTTTSIGIDFDLWNCDGEQWFETVNWFAAAREARDGFVMITLGAWHGTQAVGSYRALQQVNPMPCKLVALEPVPESVALIRRHFHNNGIDPDAHWILPMAINDRTDPVLFAITPRRMGPQNCFSTNHHSARQMYCQQLAAGGKAEEAVANQLMRNSTGIEVAGEDAAHEPLAGEIKFVSAITLNELLGPFEMVDYLESDIQQSELLVFPPFTALLKHKVRCIHIGTHGKETHATLHELFEREGWQIVFSYEPQSVHETALGTFSTQDGVLTVRNPGL